MSFSHEQDAHAGACWPAVQSLLGESLHVTPNYNLSHAFGFVLGMGLDLRLGLGFGLEMVLGYDLGTR